MYVRPDSGFGLIAVEPSRDPAYPGKTRVLIVKSASELIIRDRWAILSQP